MVCPPTRSLAFALVAGALGAPPARAVDEITPLRELIQKQQAVIAAQQQTLSVRPGTA